MPAGGGAVTPRRALGLATLFALGILVSIALIGAATAAVGRMHGDLGPWGNYAVALVFFVFGLHLLDMLTLPEAWRPQPAQSRRGPLGAIVLGLVLCVALGPGTFGIMAPVLGVTFHAASNSALVAFSVLAWLRPRPLRGDRDRGRIECVGAALACVAEPHARREMAASWMRSAGGHRRRLGGSKRVVRAIH